MKKLFTLMVMALVAMSVSAKEELPISSYSPWASTVTVEGSTITLGAGYQGGAIYVGADWTAYDYVWIKYKSASGNASFGITYDEWMKKESWGNVFASTTGTITDGDGIVGIKIDKESVMTHGNAETDGVGIGDVYAKHVQQITIQSGSAAASVTVEGIYYGTTAEFAADGGDVPVRPAYGKELVMWSGSHEYGSGWSETDVIEAKYFDVAKVGDLIRGYVTATDPNPVFKHVSDWSDFEDIQNTKTIADDKSYFEGTIATEAALAELKKSGLRLQGINFTLTKVVLINNDESEAGGEEPENSSVISFTEAKAAGALNGQTLGEGFTLTVTDTNSKISIDGNKQYFGTVAEWDKYEFRLKTGGKNDSKNALKLTLPSAGTLIVAMRSSSSTDTRNVAFIQGSTEIKSFEVKDANAEKGTVDGIDDKTVFHYYTIDNAPAGDINITYSGGTNFYAFILKTATGIYTIGTDNIVKNDVIYNLAGQRVNESYKGIVIKNGKKFIQK